MISNKTTLTGKVCFIMCILNGVSYQSYKAIIESTYKKPLIYLMKLIFRKHNV